MTKEKPDHQDAELVLKLYDLRRETVMRQSRDAIAKWVPRDWDDFISVTKIDHPHNAAWRQVSSYFEMAYGFARHGVVNAEFLAENTGEGLFLYAKVLPHLERFRRDVAPTAFMNAEWICANAASARMRLEMFQKRVAAMTAAK